MLTQTCWATESETPLPTIRCHTVSTEFSTVAYFRAHWILDPTLQITCQWEIQRMFLPRWKFQLRCCQHKADNKSAITSV